jgi:hypothetical protein
MTPKGKSLAIRIDAPDKGGPRDVCRVKSHQGASVTCGNDRKHPLTGDDVTHRRSAILGIPQQNASYARPGFVEDMSWSLDVVAALRGRFRQFRRRHSDRDSQANTAPDRWFRVDLGSSRFSTILSDSRLFWS